MDGSNDSSSTVSDRISALDLGGSDSDTHHSVNRRPRTYEDSFWSSVILRMPLRLLSLWTDGPSSDFSSDCSSGDSDTNEECYEIDERTTCQSVDCHHRYLGEVESVRGRVLMEENSVHRIPIVFLHSKFALVPGQTLPRLIVRDTLVNKVLKSAVQNNEITFLGVFPAKLWNGSASKKRVGIIGTLAEIIAYEETNGLFIVKAIGRRRFKIVEYEDDLISEPDESCHCYVRILPEITLPSVLHHYQLPSLNRMRSSQRLKCSQREASQSPWPLWIHNMYDEKHLVKDVKKRLTSNFRICKNIKYPEDPTALFVQILRTVKIRSTKIQESMALNNSIDRLNWLKNEVLRPSKKKKLTCIMPNRTTLHKRH